MLMRGKTVMTESNRTSGNKGYAIKWLDQSRTAQSSKQHQLINRLGVDVPNKDKISETFLNALIQMTFFINRLNVKPFHLFTPI